MSRCFVGAAAVALLCLASPARCAAADRYAAIAFSQSTGAYGYSWGHSSLTSARNRAVEACDAGDAQVGGWVRNGYLALALGDDVGAYGQCWGATSGRAQAGALAACSQYTTGCYVAVVVFSGR